MGLILPTGVEITVAICGSVYLISKWMRGKCRSKASLEGKTAIVTGATGGIGLYIAMDFAQRKGRVILACRNMEKAKRVKDMIVSATKNSNVVIKQVDMSKMASVRKFAEEILAEEDRVDILVNNAGMITKKKTITEEGLEVIWATNHFGPFLLTNLLLDRIIKTGDGRIVNVTSNANMAGKIEFDNINAEKYFDQKSYHNSKLAMVLVTKELSKRLQNTDTIVNTVHPGFVSTDVFRDMPIFLRMFVFTVGQLFAKVSPREGAEPVIHCAVSEEAKGHNGAYYCDCKVYDHTMWINKLAYDEGLAKKVWDMSERLTGLGNTN
ncbi:hypothetical protein FSP39_025366 [Pinctada imbricata]|uniref:Uncharacterized protein n=1 Tax=Pinctada imbricata TaxID=66713 RepID=A0AA88XJM0_PINIB|nr:hypothetical protein FSP39_025366 [Pinctada imbricata]